MEANRSTSIPLLLDTNYVTAQRIKISQICKCQVCHLISRGFTVPSLLTYHIVLGVEMWELVIFSHLEDQYEQISPF